MLSVWVEMGRPVEVAADSSLFVPDSAHFETGRVRFWEGLSPFTLETGVWSRG